MKAQAAWVGAELRNDRRKKARSCKKNSLGAKPSDAPACQAIMRASRFITPEVKEAGSLHIVKSADAPGL